MLATKDTNVVEQQTTTHVCPNCGGTSFGKLISAGRIHRESMYRERFVLERFKRRPSRAELKDLTDFAHGDAAAILACARCGVCVRDEPAEESERTYIEDPYDPALIDLLFPRYVQAFRDKAEPYRMLLPPGARVLEIGSHYGAFLRVASEWGWQPIGIDIGKDTSRYAKSKGYLVFNSELPDCAFPGAIFDGVFVWNCFEQIPEPRPLLQEIRRVLKPQGILVVRTPNALFYETCETLLFEPDQSHHAEEFALNAMAYNNLLAFPYLYGYNSGNLNELVTREDFQLAGAINSELLTLPLPEIPEWVAREQQVLRAAIERMNAAAALRPGALLTGPWIELYYRAEQGA